MRVAMSFKHTSILKSALKNHMPLSLPHHRNPLLIMAQPFFFFLFFSVCFSYDDINREMLLARRDIIYPPIDNYPTTPVTFPPDTATTIPTPTIVNVPSTNPTIDQPPTFPVTVPSTTVPLTPITNPVTSPGSVPGAQPVTNPVTTYPIPSTGVPATTPVTTYPTPSVGQSWCVAKSGIMETALQSAIDYACGNGADCSGLQEGASCYNPNTLQNHASYAFNSYYQMNPVQTSCDFGGTAITTNVNPSTGTCVFPASSSSSISSPAMATPTTSATTGVVVPSTTVSPPTVVNTSYPGSGGGDSGTPSLFPGESPPIANDSSISTAVGFRPCISGIILVTAMVTRKLAI